MRATDTNGKTKQIKIISAGVALTLAYFLLSELLSALFDRLGIKNVLVTAADVVLKLLIGVTAIVTARRLFASKSPKFSLKRTLSGIFVCGAPAWAYIALNGYASSGKTDISYSPMRTAYIIAVYALYCLAIGLVEEALNRRLILGSLASVTAKDTALVISAVVFSLSHCINFITTPDRVFATFAQLIYAFIAGMFFGAVYLRSGSLAAVTVLHAVFNFVSLVWMPFSSEASLKQATDIEPAAILSYVQVYLPLLFAALFLMRKSKAYEIDELWQQGGAVTNDKGNNNEKNE